MLVRDESSEATAAEAETEAAAARVVPSHESEGADADTNGLTMLVKGKKN